MTANKTLLIGNAIYCALIIFCLFFVSAFYLGTQEQIAILVNQRPVFFFTGRLLMDVVFIVVSLFLAFLVNLFVIRLTKSNFPLKRVLLTEFVICVISGSVFIGIVLNQAGAR